MSARMSRQITQSARKIISCFIRTCARHKKAIETQSLGQRLVGRCYNLAGGNMGLKGMESIVAELRAQRADFVNQIKHVDAALAVLGKLNGTHVRVPVRTISAAGRKRIAAAQRARWAKVR